LVFRKAFFYGLSKKNGTYQNNPALSLKLHNSIYHILEGGAPNKVKMKMKVASTSIPPHTLFHAKQTPLRKKRKTPALP